MAVITTIMAGPLLRLIYPPAMVALDLTIETGPRRATQYARSGQV